MSFFAQERQLKQKTASAAVGDMMHIEWNMQK